MTELLLKLIGAKVPDAVSVTSTSLAFRGGFQVASVVVLALALAALVWWLYRRSPQTLSPVRRYTLTALRVLFLALLLLILLRPVLALTVEGSVRRLLVMLIDDSASMQIKNPRLDADDRKRAAIAFGSLAPTNGLKQELPRAATNSLDSIARADLLKATLKNPKLDLLPRLEKEFDLVPFTFGQDLAELPRRVTATNALARHAPRDATALAAQYPWLDRLNPQAPVTALGDALRDLLVRERGQPLAGVFLVTDGANNSGSQPREIAGMFRQEGVPLYVYGLGITSPRDIIAANVFAPDVTFVKDEVPVTVRVRSQGLNGQTAKLKLLLNGNPVADRDLAFGPDGEQAVTLNFTPQMQGEFDLTAAIDPRPDEAVTDNNARTQRLKVIDTKIKVLMVEQSPRWEFRYLQAMLMRDRRIELKCVLLEGDPAIARGTNTPFLEQFPTRKDDLFKYDLVIYGDIDPRRLAASSLENLNELVSKFGGALVVVAGKKFVPSAYRRTALERLLPVELDTAAIEPAGDPVAEKPVRLELTASGRANAMLRLSDKEEESAAIWKQLPPIFWVAKVARAKPAAEVLLVDPDPLKETRFGKMPVVAFQHYGLGQVMFVGTDNTWRWRKNVGDAYYTTLWGQMMQRLSIQRLLGGSKRTQLTTDRQNYMTGERVTIYARLYTAGYEPVQEPAVKGVYGLRLGGAGRQAEVTLRPLAEQPGLYRGEFIAPTPGQYQFFVEQDLNTPLDFNVTEPKFELGETAMNESLLSEIATNTGGAFFREESLWKLPDTITARAEKVRSPLEVELWCSPLYFLLLLGVVTAEWVLRKRSQLK
ncbi:MAG: hypothetical protein HZA90_28310 [Verrucomicrobia bacterium]|nr:hypothetical protein [Verrucomicrobiota bacterium]